MHRERTRRLVVQVAREFPPRLVEPARRLRRHGPVVDIEDRVIELVLELVHVGDDPLLRARRRRPKQDRAEERGQDHFHDDAK